MIMVAEDTILRYGIEQSTHVPHAISFERMHKSTQSLHPRRENNMHMIREDAKRMEECTLHILRHHQIIDNYLRYAFDNAPRYFVTSIGRDMENADLCIMDLSHCYSMPEQKIFVSQQYRLYNDFDE